MAEKEGLKLVQKLKNIYEAVDHVEKKGKNDAFAYDYVRAADVARAIRNALIQEKIYAQPIMTVIRQYTFTTSSGKPMNAVDLNCEVHWHDIESGEVIVTNGLGSGSDPTDKAIYKAQTGAIKYALRNAFLIPDELDPENDSHEEREERPRAKAKPGPKPRQSAITGDMRASVEVPVPPQLPPPVTPLESTKPEATPDRPSTPEELAGFHTRAKVLSQKLAYAGLKSDDNGAPTLKVAKFISKKANVPVLSQVGFNMWTIILDKLEERVNNDVAGTIKLIDETLKG